MTDNGFLMPKRERSGASVTILRPGCLGNVFTGGVAALISWGLYGPLSAYLLLGSQEALAGNQNLAGLGLSLSSLVGAILVGMGGARWLSSEVDKSLLRAAAAHAAAGHPSLAAAQQIALAPPAQALGVARNLVK
nr:hypothetical protein [uncultured Holophaga sp.]